MGKQKNLSAFAKNLKKLRIEQGLSQDELGGKVGVSRGSISFYENDDRIPDMEVLRKMKEVFNVDYDFLFGEVPYKNPKQKRAIQEKAETLQSAISGSDVDSAGDIVELLRLILETGEKNNVAAITLPAVAQILAGILDILAVYSEKSAINPAALLIYERFNSILAAESTQAAEPFGIKTPLESWLQDFTYVALPHCKDIQQNAHSFMSDLQKSLFDTAKENSNVAIADIAVKAAKAGVSNAKT